MNLDVTPEMFDPRRDPSDELAGIEPWPAPLAVERIPAGLRENPIVKAYLAMAPEEHADLATSAACDADDDEAVAAALIASVR